MHIGLTFPVRNRVRKLRRLIESIGPLSGHKVTFCLGLDKDEPAMGAYLKLFDEVQSPTVEVDYFVFNHTWQGMGVAFNDICNRLPPKVETIAMFGDDMVFNNNGQAVFDRVAASFAEWAPDKIGCVCFNDTTWNFSEEREKTHNGPPIAINGFLSRNWLSALGYFFPNEILGDFADNYVTELCCRLNRYHVIYDIKIPHLHQDFNPKERDQTGVAKRQYEKDVKYNSGKQVWESLQGTVDQDYDRLKAFIDNYPSLLDTDTNSNGA